jgi:RND superfamily putative drug exporter
LAIVLLWAGLLVGLGAAALGAGTSYSSSFSLKNTESARAYQLLDSAFPGNNGDSATIVWHSSAATVRDPALAARMTKSLDSVAHLPGMVSVSSPYSAAGAGQISADGHTSYATVQLASGAQAPSSAQLHTLVQTAQHASSSTLDVEVGGSAVQQSEQAPNTHSEMVGIVAAAVVLFAALGSLFAMALPILTGVAGVGGGLMAIGLLSHAMNMANFAPTLGALIGLGVGIDYALFIVTRYRSALRSGHPVVEAIDTAVNTSGRAVLFAGGTVCIALLGMMVLGLGFLNGVALAASVTVAFTVLAALTLLPALLSMLGLRVFSRRERRRLALNGRREQGGGADERRGLWRRWAGCVERRPGLTSLLALLLMVALALPVLSLRLGASDSGSDPVGTTTRQAYDLMARGFGPGINGPLTLVADLPPGGGAADTAGLTRLVSAVEHTPGVASAQVGARSADGRVEMVTVAPTTSPQSRATADLITTLREQVVPKALAGTGVHVYVGGLTAVYVDFASVLSGKLPLFVALIAALGFLLLVLAFRSLLAPLTAAVMNLLAAAASFGLVTAFFQWGWGSQKLGMGGAGPVEAFLPVMLVAILFGLSMDYQVFLVSRMHEEWVRHRDNARAVKIGQVETSRVITAAATIMISVFSAFAFGSQRVIGEFGIGLAAAVALDAFVLRTVLVPAAMHLFGAANWWLPAWLDRRLPHLHGKPKPCDPDHTPVPAPRRRPQVGVIPKAPAPAPSYD